MKKVLNRWLGKELIVILPYHGSQRGTLHRGMFNGSYQISINGRDDKGCYLAGGVTFRHSDVEFINVSGNRAIWLKGAERPKASDCVKEIFQ